MTVADCGDVECSSLPSHSDRVDAVDGLGRRLNGAFDAACDGVIVSAYALMASRAPSSPQPATWAQPRMRELRGVQQPPEERLALMRAAELHQRAQRERRVPQPAEAVVRIALPAELLGQRRTGRSRDPPDDAWISSLSASALRMTASRHGPA